MASALGRKPNELAQKQVEAREVFRAKKRQQRRKQLEQERLDLGLTEQELPDQISDDDEDTQRLRMINVDNSMFSLSLPSGDQFRPFGTRFSLELASMPTVTSDMEGHRAVHSSGPAKMDQSPASEDSGEICEDIPEDEGQYLMQVSAFMDAARKAGLRTVEVTNLREFFDHHRKLDGGMLLRML